MGLMKDILVFNTATPLESDNVGAYIRDSAGNLIDSTLIATKHWLNVTSALFDGSGNAIASTSGALNVNISSGMINVGVVDKSAFTYGTTDEQPVGGVFQDTLPTLTAGTTGAARLTSFRAFHMNLRDSSGNELLGQKVMAASIPVVLSSDQSAISVLTTDPALANMASKATAVSVTTTAAAVIASALANRKSISIQNNSATSIYIGDATVTNLTGTRVPPGATYQDKIGPANSLFALSALGTADVRVLEIS